MSRLGRAVAAAVAAVALPACAASVGAGSGGGVRTIELTIHHSQFSASALDVRPGETVRFVVHNTDPIGHELIVGDQAVQDAHEAGTDAHHDGTAGVVSVAAGATAETTYRFGPAPGTVLFGCHLPGHWAYGMHGTITVG